MFRVALVAGFVLAAAGCGSSAGPSGGGATTGTAPSVQVFRVLVAPPGSPRFDKTVLRVQAGRVNIGLRNKSALHHAIAVRGKGVDVKGTVVGKGGTSAISVTLRPGTYVFYCPVDGHEAAGMHGRLIVTR